MVIVVVYKGLEVANLNLLLASVAFEERVQLKPHRLVATQAVEVGRVALEQPLDDVVALEFIVGDA